MLPATLPGGTIGVPYSQTVLATGSNGTPYAFAVTTGALPTGLTLNASTGTIQGTPTAGGTFNFTITATDTFGCIGSTAYSVTIACPNITITPSSLPNGTTGVAYNRTIQASGGTDPYTFSITGTLPTGLTMDAAGNISGTPTATGTFNFTVTATDFNGCQKSKAYTITIECAAVTLIPAAGPLADGTTGVLYSQFVTGSGGTAPYTYSVTGSLPGGLTLNTATGEISGTPNVTGTFNFTVTATDLYGCQNSGAYSITINCATVLLTPASGALPAAIGGTAYSQFVTASGGTAPYNYTISSGLLPAGLSLNSSTGEISGTPTATGSSSFDISVTDAFGCGVVQSYTLDVNCPTITLSPATLPNGVTTILYNQTVIASGGSGTITYSFTGTLPNGVTLNTATGVLNGTPTVTGTFNFTITATDALGCTGSQSYSVTIALACLFCDEFDDNTLDPNWSYVKPSWSEDGNNLVGASTKKALAVAQPVFGGCRLCSVEADMNTAGGSGNVLSLFGWYVNSKNSMELMLKEEANKIVLKQRVNGVIVKKLAAAVTIDPGTAYDVKVTFDGTQFEVFVDGVSKMTFVPVGTVPTGTVGFQSKKTTGTFGFINVQ